MATTTEIRETGRTLSLAALVVAALLALGAGPVAAKVISCPLQSECRGSKGDDRMQVAGESLVEGKGGDDTITVPGGASSILGGPGNDTIRATNVGFNEIIGGNGSDVIDARNGDFDEVDCGPGQDKVAFDAGVDSVKNCEGKLK